MITNTELCALTLPRPSRRPPLPPPPLSLSRASPDSTPFHTLPLPAPQICANAQKYFGVDVMMHLTCTGLTRVQLRSALTDAKEAGIHNILALRGDPARGTWRWGERRRRRGEEDEERTNQRGEERERERDVCLEGKQSDSNTHTHTHTHTSSCSMPPSSSPLYWD